MEAAELIPRGRLDFEFEGDPKRLEVHVFECPRLLDHASTPMETDEMRPAWYAVADVPYPHMWVDDVRWLPRVLAGQTVTDYILFRGHETILAQRPLTPDELAASLPGTGVPAAPGS